jgi:hypothetical protein
MVDTPFWDSVEPHWDDENGTSPPFPCYSKTLKAFLIPGTFVILSSRNDTQHGCVVARIVRTTVNESSSTAPLRNSLSATSVEVNVFQRLNELAATAAAGFVRPEFLAESHLRHLPEIVQTAELRVISSNDIMDIAFVFTKSALQDSSNMYGTCQGMAHAFLLRFRCKLFLDIPPMLIVVPDEHCRPFPSSYSSTANAAAQPPAVYFHDCFPRRTWNSLMCIKLEITKLLGRYSHLQGLHCKDRCRLSNFSSETWGYLRLQFEEIFNDITCGVSTRIRRHRVNESGLVVKAVQVHSSCTILRFETKTHLQQLCHVFGESTTVGQRCRLPKISVPKPLWQNDIINVVSGSDVPEPVFNARTVCDGVDLEFDGCSTLFITVRYRRFSYTGSNSLAVSVCDPLLSALIRREDPYDDNNNVLACELTGEEEERGIIAEGSEFQDYDGCLYEVRIGVAVTSQVRCRCIYPRRNNPLYGLEKLFDLSLVRSLIEHRLYG